MGSKISKAVTRRKGEEAEEAVTRQGNTTSQQHGAKDGPCQASCLPDIKPNSPLLVALRTSEAGTPSLALSAAVIDNSTNDDTNMADKAELPPTPPQDTPMPTIEIETGPAIRFASSELAACTVHSPSPPTSPQPNQAPSPTSPTYSPTSPTAVDVSTEETSQPQIAEPVEPEISCIICCEKFPEKDCSGPNSEIVFPCRCNSAYCKGCVKDMFVNACKDVSRMPPRCCNQIHLHMARPYLSDEEAQNFREKYEQWSTPNPFYCPVATCSAFIPIRVLNQSRDLGKGKQKQRVDSVIGTPTSQTLACPKCEIDICTSCRQLSHAGSPCKQLAFGVDEQTAELLQRWGYKRCPKCGNGVRRMFGCNHMECFCGAHWCWVCQKHRDECDGGCYEESEAGSDDEGSDEENPRPTVSQIGEEASNSAEGSTENGESAATGEASTQTEEAAKPQAIPRARNYDARSRHYWESSGFDFGDEPTDEIQDKAWDCDHHFAVHEVSYSDSLSRAASVTNMECTRCWRSVHPEIQAPQNINTAVAGRMIAGYSRGRGRGRGRGRATIRRGGLVRSDATLRSPLSQSFPSDPLPESMAGVVYTSNNGDRVVDTYGNIITTTDFTIGHEQPRRASFEFTFESDIKIDTSAKLENLDPRKKLRGAAGEQGNFSFAYECDRCDAIVCEDCKEDMLQEMETRGSQDD